MNKRDNKELERRCRYCECARTLLDEDSMLCEKKGIVAAAYRCRHFRYDPLKRDPGTLRTAPVLEYVSLDDE